MRQIRVGVGGATTTIARLPPSASSTRATYGVRTPRGNPQRAAILRWAVTGVFWRLVRLSRLLAVPSRWSAAVNSSGAIWRIVSKVARLSDRLHLFVGAVASREIPCPLHRAGKIFVALAAHALLMRSEIRNSFADVLSLGGVPAQPPGRIGRGSFCDWRDGCYQLWNRRYAPCAFYECRGLLNQRLQFLLPVHLPWSPNSHGSMLIWCGTLVQLPLLVVARPLLVRKIVADEPSGPMKFAASLLGEPTHVTFVTQVTRQDGRSERCDLGQTRRLCLVSGMKA